MKRWIPTNRSPEAIRIRIADSSKATRMDLIMADTLCELERMGDQESIAYKAMHRQLTTKLEDEGC